MKTQKPKSNQELADDAYREYVQLYHSNVPAKEIEAAYNKWRELCRKARFAWDGTPECGE